MALADFWRLLRTVDQLLKSEAENSQTFTEIQNKLTELERRIARLESREDIMAVEARSAARTGASDAMQGVILQIGERLGALESHQPQLPGQAPMTTTATRKRAKPKPE